MNYFEKFEAQDQKLANILEEKYLLHKFERNTYPMTLTIMQNPTPEAQMALYDQESEGVSSQDAKLVLTFLVGEISVRVYGRLIISETLMNKIKNHGKKMRDLWLQGDYAARMERRGAAYTTSLDLEDDPGDYQETVEDDSAFDGFYDGEEDTENDGGEA